MILFTSGKHQEFERLMQQTTRSYDRGSDDDRKPVRKAQRPAKETVNRQSNDSHRANRRREEL